MRRSSRPDGSPWPLDSLHFSFKKRRLLAYLKRCHTVRVREETQQLLHIVDHSAGGASGGAKKKSAICPNKSALEGDVERRASLCAGVVHRNARMQFNENEAAALFHLEHA